MSEVSPGERALLRLRWFVYDAGGRPVVVASVLILLAVLAAMAAALVGASTDLTGGLRNWVFFARFGFTTDVELGVLIAAILLMVDSRAGGPFRGQRSLFWMLAVAAVAGVVANIAAIVASLTEPGMSELALGTTAEVWAEVLAASLSSTLVASTAAWIALTEARSLPTEEGAVHEF